MTTGPTAALACLSLFSVGFIDTQLLSCPMNLISRGLADTDFVKNYCYANLYDYKVNATTGEVTDDHRASLLFLKLYPYKLLGLAVMGSFVQGMWCCSNISREIQVNNSTKLKIYESYK